MTLALAAGAAGVAAAPTASAATHLVVCPLAAGVQTCCGPPVVVSSQADLIPCCPVPTAMCCDPLPASGCCGSPVCPAMSLSATPDPAEAGETVTVQGTLRASASTVALWERQAGQAAFSQVATAAPSASGEVTFQRVVQTDVEWYATAGSVTTATIDEPVQATVGVQESSPGVLSGKIVPSHAGERVAVQRRRGRRWVTIARPMLDAGSRFSLALSVGKHRRERVRVVLAADARNALSVSRALMVG